MKQNYSQTLGYLENFCDDIELLSKIAIFYNHSYRLLCHLFWAEFVDIEHKIEANECCSNESTKACIIKSQHNMK